MSDKFKMTDLCEMFVLGRDMPAARWREGLSDRAFHAVAQKLVWQSDGTRFLPEDGFVPEGPVSLAHPVALDAAEILRWRGVLAGKGVRQPFRQMWEPVVLVDGRLPGKMKRVQSAGESYSMLDRYSGYRLPLSALPDLKKEGFQFIIRQKWDADNWRRAEIQVVNIVTPAGILYECRPSARVEKLAPEGDVSLILGPFYPFEGTRLRTLNHVAAVLEESLIPEMVGRDALDLLLPHLPGMDVERLKALLGRSPEGGRTAALLTKLIAREEARP